MTTSYGNHFDKVSWRSDKLFLLMLQISSSCFRDMINGVYFTTCNLKWVNELQHEILSQPGVNKMYYSVMNITEQIAKNDHFRNSYHSKVWKKLQLIQKILFWFSKTKMGKNSRWNENFLVLCLKLNSYIFLVSLFEILVWKDTELTLAWIKKPKKFYTLES